MEVLFVHVTPQTYQHTAVGFELPAPEASWMWMCRTQQTFSLYKDNHQSYTHMMTSLNDDIYHVNR